MTKIHSAQVVPYSSVVGQGIMLLNKAEACIGILAVTAAENPQDVAEQVAGRINGTDPVYREIDLEIENIRAKEIREADARAGDFNALLAQAREEGRIAGLREAAATCGNLSHQLLMAELGSEGRVARSLRSAILSLIPATPP